MAQASQGTQLKRELFFQTKNQWDVVSPEQQERILRFTDPYRAALDAGKTERSFYRYCQERLEKAGFRPLESVKELKAGDKVYRSIRDKGLVALQIGREPLTEGLRLVGSHIDSPRLDLKPNSLYEKHETVLMKTHYYGGIKKYQWLATALALHGFVVLKNGEERHFVIGEKEDDPVFTITDLLPHLARDQMKKSAREFVTGEGLNVLVGGLPFPEKDLQERFKLGVLQLLHQHYGLTERDLISAEVEVVPAQKAKDVGFDRSFVGAYGQDDRVCAWTSLEALIDSKPQEASFGIILFDKEEVGSDGNTGAKSQAYRHALVEIQAKQLGRSPELLEAHAMIANSRLLSSDVTNAFDPNYPEVSDPLNAAFCGRGMNISKYTGHGGKGGTSDANAEFFAEVTQLLDRKDIPWQVGELGKVDQGGGGTIAMFFANDGMDVLDCGVALYSMHSCFEIASKIDIYYTYEAYKAFMTP